MEWRILTPEEEKAREDAIPPEIREEQERKAAWDEKHPKCEECGQFLKKRPPRDPNSLALRLGSDAEDLWYSHYVRDYWGEYDHI